MRDRWPALLDRAGAAEYLSVSTATFDRMVADKTFRPVLVRGSKLIRYRRLELDDVIDGLPRGDDAEAVSARQVGPKH